MAQPCLQKVEFRPHSEAAAVKPGIDADEMLLEAPELEARSVYGGVAWMPVDNLTLNFALMRAFYDTETTSTGVEALEIINSLELAHRFRADLIGRIEQNRKRRCARLRILRLRIGQRWSEAGM